MPRVTFYSHFARFTNGDRETKVDGVDVRSTISNLVQRYGHDFSARLLKENGEPKEFVRIFLNDRDIRLIGNLDAKTGPEDRVLFVPAVAGG